MPIGYPICLGWWKIESTNRKEPPGGPTGWPNAVQQCDSPVHRACSVVERLESAGQVTSQVERQATGGPVRVRRALGACAVLQVLNSPKQERRKYH